MIFISEPVEKKRGRPCIGDKPMSARELKRRERSKKNEQRISKIAVLDTETDPFDNKTRSEVFPFLAVLYSDDFEPVIIWDENRKRFVRKLIAAIKALPDEYTIYAHNGGKFDFMFLVSELRGSVSFKGRGIMEARIGNHILRDSFHIIPEKLANLEKEAFDYKCLYKGTRDKFRREIISYCISDCRNLLKYVKEFLNEFGFRISIGQAAMAELKKHYKVQSIGANEDAFLRHYFFGGRVECLEGAGHFIAPVGKTFKYYDVNSMYPYAMANYKHPICRMSPPRRGEPNEKTIFIDLNCRNYGALIARNENGETTATIERGRFRTTIWEYKTAMRLGLITDVRINFCIDYERRSDFSEFVNPRYEQRRLITAAMEKVSKSSPEYFTLKKDNIFIKLVLNNAYGKFAQNPRNFKEHYFTDPRERPPKETEMAKGLPAPWGDMPSYRSDTHWIWSRPAPGIHFNNVGTAASITGAARSILMEAIYNAEFPIYCDTDSLMCLELNNTELDNLKLGAWKLEKEIDEIIICGKKLYATKQHKRGDRQRDNVTVRSKGTSGLDWADMLAILDGKLLEVVNKGPTLTKTGSQYYLSRTIGLTTRRKLSRAKHENGIRNFKRLRTGTRA